MLSKAAVLCALYDAAKPQGFGHLEYAPEDLTMSEAAILILNSPHMYFDYIRGRVMKVHIAGVEVDTSLYNRDNGKEAAERAIEKLREELKQEEAKMDEPILPDDYPVHATYYYVVDDVAIRSEVAGTVRDLKHSSGGYEVRRCDIVARGLPLTS